MGAALALGGDKRIAELRRIEPPGLAIDERRRKARGGGYFPPPQTCLIRASRPQLKR